MSNMRSETFLSGQIPVKDADSAQFDEARRTGRQPNPADAATAVNRDLLDAARNAEDRKTGD